MNITLRNFILKILELIGYTDDKEKYADTLLAKITFETILSLGESLPLEKQKTLDNALADAANNSDVINKILLEYFPQEIINKTSNEETIKQIRGLLEAVKNTLSSDQKNQIEEYINNQLLNLLSKIS